MRTAPRFVIEARVSDNELEGSETLGTYFEVWHDRNLIYEATTLAMALQFVLAQSEDAAAEMRLLEVYPGGSTLYAQGAALYARARAQSRQPAQHRVVIISEPLPGSDPESIAVDLLKRVFLDGELQLISIEVRRQTEEDSDDWDNVLVSDQTGDLWMKAVARFRAERKAERKAGGDAATGKEPS